MKKILLSTTILIIMASLINANEILGKWKSIYPKEKNMTMQIFEDNTMITKLSSKKIEMDSKWIILSDGRFKMTIEFMGISQTKAMEFKIEKDKLFFTKDNNITSIFKRIKL